MFNPQGLLAYSICIPKLSFADLKCSPLYVHRWLLSDNGCTSNFVTAHPDSWRTWADNRWHFWHFVYPIIPLGPPEESLGICGGISIVPIVLFNVAIVLWNAAHCVHNNTTLLWVVNWWLQSEVHSRSMSCLSPKSFPWGQFIANFNVQIELSVIS